jgi:nitroreductase
MPDQDDLMTALQLAELLEKRRSILPKRLIGPALTEPVKQALLKAAASAPDHDQILPWRLVEIPELKREALGLAFQKALLDRDPSASAQDGLQAREKAFRAAWLVLLIVRMNDQNNKISAQERLISAGAAVQNMLLMATSMGLGSSLTSGQAMNSLALRGLFKLQDNEQAICFLNFGHIQSQRSERKRPEVQRFFSIL